MGRLDAEAVWENQGRDGATWRLVAVAIGAARPSCAPRCRTSARPRGLASWNGGIGSDISLVGLSATATGSSRGWAGLGSKGCGGLYLAAWRLFALWSWHRWDAMTQARSLLPGPAKRARLVSPALRPSNRYTSRCTTSAQNGRPWVPYVRCPPDATLTAAPGVSSLSWTGRLFRLAELSGREHSFSTRSPAQDAAPRSPASPSCNKTLPKACSPPPRAAPPGIAPRPNRETFAFV